MLYSTRLLDSTMVFYSIMLLYSTMLHSLPILDLPSNETVLPRRPTLRRLAAEPYFVKSKTLTADPMRTRRLNEMALRDGENTQHTGFPENREKQKGKKHRRTDLANFENSQGLYAYVFFLFVFHNFPEIQYVVYFLRPYIYRPFLVVEIIKLECFRRENQYFSSQ